MSLRSNLRVGIDHAARGLGLLQSFERRMRGGLTVLMYHRVLEARDCVDYPFPSLVMPAPHFEAQVAWLAHRTRPVTLGEGLEDRSEAADLPSIALTFDDGYWDNAAIVAPILERFGVRATFFVTSGFVESGEPMWFDRTVALVRGANSAQLAKAASASECPIPAKGTQGAARVSAVVEALKGCTLERRERFLEHLGREVGAGSGAELFRPMAPAEVAQLHASGHEIGSHSKSHAILPLLTDGELEAELTESRAQLRSWIGAEVRGFCYPNGSHDARVVEAARRAGYAYACTTEVPIERRPTDLLRLGRHDVTPGRVTRSSGMFDLTAFRAEISGLHARLR